MNDFSEMNIDSRSKICSPYFPSAQTRPKFTAGTSVLWPFPDPMVPREDKAFPLGTDLRIVDPY